VKLKTIFIRCILSFVTLAHTKVGERVTISQVGGERSFRRRLMELGLVPGTHVELVGIAPLGDPMELLVRGCSLSIRHTEALSIAVKHNGNGAETLNGATSGAASAALCATGCGSCGGR